MKTNDKGYTIDELFEMPVCLDDCYDIKRAKAESCPHREACAADGSFRCSLACMRKAYENCTRSEKERFRLVELCNMYRKAFDSWYDVCRQVVDAREKHEKMEGCAKP